MSEKSVLFFNLQIPSGLDSTCIGIYNSHVLCFLIIWYYEN